MCRITSWDGADLIDWVHLDVSGCTASRMNTPRLLASVRPGPTRIRSSLDSLFGLAGFHSIRFPVVSWIDHPRLILSTCFRRLVYTIWTCGLVIPFRTRTRSYTTHRTTHITISISMANRMKFGSRHSHSYSRYIDMGTSMSMPTSTSTSVEWRVCTRMRL